jgi:hypothetical protein
MYTEREYLSRDEGNEAFLSNLKFDLNTRHLDVNISDAYVCVCVRLKSISFSRNIPPEQNPYIARYTRYNRV